MLVKLVCFDFLLYCRRFQKKLGKWDFFFQLKNKQTNNDSDKCFNTWNLVERRTKHNIQYPKIIIMIPINKNFYSLEHHMKRVAFQYKKLGKYFSGRYKWYPFARYICNAKNMDMLISRNIATHLYIATSGSNFLWMAAAAYNSGGDTSIYWIKMIGKYKVGADQVHYTHLKITNFVLVSHLLPHLSLLFHCLCLESKWKYKWESIICHKLMS